jgi:hypothetical protein
MMMVGSYGASTEMGDGGMDLDMVVSMFYQLEMITDGPLFFF